jgi:hypothetical protein
VVPDETGDWIVWVADRGDDLWLCDANAAGDIYVWVAVYGDLLEGEGANYLAVTPVNGPADSEAARVQTLCEAVLPPVVGATALATFADGLNDYFIWLGTPSQHYYLCNADGEGALYAFIEVGDPIYRPSAPGPSPASSSPSDALVES